MTIKVYPPQYVEELVAEIERLQEKNELAANLITDLQSRLHRIEEAVGQIASGRLLVPEYGGAVTWNKHPLEFAIQAKTNACAALEEEA